MEIEQSREAYIPNELSNDNLPSSFWFYDACLQQVQNLVDPEKKTFAIFKNQYRLNFYQQNNFKKQMLMKLGLIDNPKLEVKLALKYQQINQIQTNQINHHLSTSAMNLQRSRYVVIDDDVTRLQRHFTIQGVNQQNELKLQEAISGCTAHAKLSADFRNETRNLILRYCPDTEINQKRQENLLVKSTFLNKIYFMKILGKKLVLMERIDKYIQDHIDDLYQSYIKVRPRKVKTNKTVYEVVMAEKLEKEEEEHAKKKLHSTMLSTIEQWFNTKIQKIRRSSINDVRQKNDKNLAFFTKNYFIDTGIEKHIPWYSKGRRLDMREILVNEMEKVRQKQEAMRHQHRAELIAKQDPQTLREEELKVKLDNITQIKGRAHDKDLEKETQTIMMKYNMERIADLKRKIAEGEQVMMERAQKLNEQRAIYKHLLGFQQEGIKELLEKRHTIKEEKAELEQSQRAAEKAPISDNGWD